MSAAVSGVPTDAQVTDIIRNMPESFWDAEVWPSGNASYVSGSIDVAQRRRLVRELWPSFRDQIAAEVLGPVRELVAGGETYSIPVGESDRIEVVIADELRAALSAPVQAETLVEHAKTCGGCYRCDIGQPGPVSAAEDACVHCGQPMDAHGALGPWCVKAGYYGNRYTSPDPVQAAEPEVVTVRMLHRTPNHAKGQFGTLHDASPSGHVNERLKWVDYGEPIQWSHGQSESTGEWCGPGEYEIVPAAEEVDVDGSL